VRFIWGRVEEFVRPLFLYEVALATKLKTSV